ncbi:hypothetical protein IscW_ISCW013616 [Ixodes scapularis]|uniref:Uncharacterized protein n=1 Tax=Ixodes scapularis TaxID=6945 RepID=B7QGW5_IXOSC|nr:hypothetical protein IscW_ISCW013616 [Ixodes scapularis]|eukprot:XP_002414421.1 hypothetical protein IscW_ISCW013616 [Ixodes scapularis]
MPESLEVAYRRKRCHYILLFSKNANPWPSWEQFIFNHHCVIVYDCLLNCRLVSVVSRLCY